MPRAKVQVRRRQLPAELKPAFDRAALGGEDAEYLAKRFKVELWYAKKRIAEVMARKERGVQPEPPMPAEDPIAAACEDLTPTEYARVILGSQVAALPHGHFRLDGRPAGAREIVRAANAKLRSLGRQEILYPGLQPLRG